MKPNQTVEELSQLAWDNGEAKKGMYAIVRENDCLTLLLRKEMLAKFRVTGYQQGVLEANEASTKAQDLAVRTFVGYFTGEFK
ncbi:hypothetical protein SAMN02745116_00049 [Pilibacter termitis]|uniref:Uncharacterized protein n=1 Tax=Pilibacter termitis TaxID=263852 RepID=A0A1T4K2S2_9ENTE|nr:hypothetical protein [Pilibacter termitis]SJZ36643.1 hypothetical protein SAMN02745116_00049 [Pilibacter termitis]